MWCMERDDIFCRWKCVFLVGLAAQSTGARTADRHEATAPSPQLIQLLSSWNSAANVVIVKMHCPREIVFVPSSI